MKMALKLNTRIFHQFGEKMYEPKNVLIWKSLVIGFLASIMAIGAVIVFHNISSGHQTMLLVRYLILSISIGFGIYHLTYFSPKIKSHNSGILVGLIITLTMAIGVIIGNFLLPFWNVSYLIMDNFFQVNDHLQFAIMELELLVNAIVIGFFISLIFCLIFIKE